MKRAVFLDRDGVLNRAILREGKYRPPHGLDELQLYPDAPDALARLKSAGFMLIAVTNQPDVGRGTQTVAGVEAINAAISARLPIDDWFVCYHAGHEGCACRKPKPGMILEAVRKHAIDPACSFMIGDRWSDVDCGIAAGVTTIWIDRRYGERDPAGSPHYRARTLAEAVDWILAAA